MFDSTVVRFFLCALTVTTEKYCLLYWPLVPFGQYFVFFPISSMCCFLFLVARFFCFQLPYLLAMK